MALKLMYITNDPQIAKIAEDNGTDRIFVDMEWIGKEERQGNMDTVKSNHTFDDIEVLRKTINKAQLLVRCNPIHDEVEGYLTTEEEINEIVKRKADIIMLPYFKTLAEVKRFVNAVGGRAKTMLLVETPEAVEIIDDILKVDGIDEMYIGLNDLSLGYKKRFMFELLADGTVENLTEKFKAANKPFGFGGIAAMGTGTLPAEKILTEHYRVGSGCVILSRSFCNCADKSPHEVESIFSTGVAAIRKKEEEVKNYQSEQFIRNKNEVKEFIDGLLIG